MKCKHCKKPVHETHWTLEEGEKWTQHWVHDDGTVACYRNPMSDSTAEPSTDNLEGFLAVYAPTDPDGNTRVVLDLDMDEHGGDTLSPFIIVRHQGRVLILNPMALADHLCVDAHAFVNGEDARTGVMAMEDGARTSLEYLSDGPSAGYPFGLSHRWPAAKLVALLLGKQEES